MARARNKVKLSLTQRQRRDQWCSTP